MATITSAELRAMGVVPRGEKSATKTKPAKRGMNGWETKYAKILEQQRRAGVIAWWRFESMRFKLANGAWFKPDFAVVQNDGKLELYEVKGYWREAAKLRIKVAADQFPFTFVVVKKAGSGWTREVIK
jgi:hypothetical protein